MDRGTLWFSSQSQVDHSFWVPSKIPQQIGTWAQHVKIETRKTDFTGWWYTYPSKNMKVRWDDYPQYMENNKCSKPPTIFNYVYIYTVYYIYAQ
jgi:hypothetical protein